jgi:hypothetical protein
MAPKKLTEPDKKKILELYRHPEETTSTLAGRYGVSNSTISRLLKATLPAEEYSALIQQKRAAAEKGTADKTAPKTAPKLEKAASTPESAPAEAATPEKTTPKLRTRKSSSGKASSAAIEGENNNQATPPAEVQAAVTAASESDQSEEAVSPVSSEKAVESTDNKPKLRRRRSRATQNDSEEAAQLSLPDPVEPVDPEEVEEPEAEAKPTSAVPRPVLRGNAPVVDEEAEDLDAEWDESPALDDDYSADEDDDDDDDDYDDDLEGWDETDNKTAPHLGALEIYPLAEANLPQLCYVVVERSSSELVALPLRTFADLGQIPETEGESRTLPVFDNHRVARRFSRRNQRVVKVPDGTILQTTSPYLQAKGITRLLIDGQVFALDEETSEMVDAQADAN